METTVKDFFDGVAEGKLQVTLPLNMKVDINGDRCYHIERIHENGYRYLRVPKGSPQEGMYWRSAQPTAIASIFEDPKVQEKAEEKISKPRPSQNKSNTQPLPVEPKKEKPIKLEKK